MPILRNILNSGFDIQISNQKGPMFEHFNLIILCIINLL